MKKSTFAVVILALILPQFAIAHGAHGNGFIAGFTHPIFGLDHAFTIFGIGVLSYYLDPKKWYLYPLAFIAPMVIGGLLGIGQLGSVIVEKFISASVVLTGLSIALLKQKSHPMIFVILAIFGALHGFAHGTEIPEETTALQYVSGFFVGAAVLSVVGLVLSRVIDETVNSLRYYVLIGGMIAGAGCMILLS